MQTSDRGPIPIMIKVWAGPAKHDVRYIKRSLPSLLKSDLPEGTRIVLVDDQSTNEEVLRMLRELPQKDPRVQVWRNHERMGPNTGQAYNFAKLVETFPTAKVLVTCDDDVIYHPGWLQRLLQVYDEALAVGLEGVFTALNTPARPAFGERTLPTSTVILKQRQMALNWMVPRAVYDKVGPFRDVGIAFDSDYCTRMIELGLPVICLKPSYVQNIGYFGAYQNSNALKAYDYVGRRDAYLLSRDLWFQFMNGLEWLNESPPGKIARPYLKKLLRRA
jgi:glycosyltransferase involved in cell wall biosynthesis